ncbi:MAG: hypothetical protein ACKVTZ_06045 [Bacteroidia bacterium]
MKKIFYTALFVGLGTCSLNLQAQAGTNTLTIKGVKKDVTLQWTASDNQTGKNYLITDENEQPAAVETWKRGNGQENVVVLNGKIAEADKKELEKLIRDSLDALGVKGDVNISINDEQ